MSTPPLTNTYWVRPGELLAGEYPGAELESVARDRLETLVRAGIRTFVDLTEDGELLPYASMLPDLASELQVDVAYHRLSIRDADVPEHPDQMRAILDVIDQSLAQNRPVYVHCWGGIGRTGTVIGCWLSRRCGSGEQAFEELQRLWLGCAKSARRGSPETWEQRNYIRNWSNE